MRRDAQSVTAMDAAINGRRQDEPFTVRYCRSEGIVWCQGRPSSHAPGTFRGAKKNEARIAAGFVYNWCPEEDSNLHGVAPAST